MFGTSGGVEADAAAWRGAHGQDGGVAKLVLVNGPPAAGKSTVSRRYVDDHEGAVLVEVDALRMTLPGWEDDPDTRLVARDLAGAAMVEHLAAGRDVVMPQYFGRLGYIVVMDDLARQHDATFVEVVLAMSASTAIDRFRRRRQAMVDEGERHPERDIVDAEVEAFIRDAVERLERLPERRPNTRTIPVDPDDTEDHVYQRLVEVVDA